MPTRAPEDSEAAAETAMGQIFTHEHRREHGVVSRRRLIKKKQEESLEGD
jgi:hypothetical protein